MSAGTTFASAPRMARLPKLDENEQERLRALFAYEARLYGDGARVVVGVDEVGRGALAGPVTVGAVILGADWQPVPGLNDSKKLSKARRELVAEHLRECVQTWHVAHVGAEVVDEIGIMGALRRAMVEAVAGLDAGVGADADAGSSPDAVLIDGNPMNLFRREVAIVRGDGQVACIAAASVLAKVERDALMRELDEHYPDYGFASNAGYGSSTHCAVLVEKGLSPVHRRSFCGKILQDTLF